MGPNVKKLVAVKMAKDAIPDGCNGLIEGVQFLSDPKRIAAGARAAQVWVEQAIVVVRAAKAPNPWKDATDEDIAGEILRKLDEQKRQVRK